MKTGLIILIVVLVVLVLWLVATYNSLVSLRNRVRDAWSQIDVQLKRRFDMVPNLVDIVKGYTKHESETLENVVKARNTYLSANLPEEQMKADGELTKAINKLFALTESYPDLKANQNFLELQASLEQTEDKIAIARQFYNDIVLQYNNKVEMFPSNLVAGIFKFTKETFFKALEEEKENVKIKF